MNPGGGVAGDPAKRSIGRAAGSFSRILAAENPLALLTARLAELTVGRPLYNYCKSCRRPSRRSMEARLLCWGRDG